MEVGGDLGADAQLVVAAGSSEQLQSLHGEAAVVEARLLRLVRHADIEVELLQGPGVGLGHALPGSRDEGLGVEQTWKYFMTILTSVTTQDPLSPPIQTVMLFSWLAPPPLTALLTLANCFTRPEKSVTQEATEQEVGTL